MKKLLIVLFALLPMAAFGADQCPLPDGCYTDRVTYEIIGVDGAVVDKTVYERLVPVSYADAMVLKYIRLIRNTEGGAKAFMSVLKAGGDAGKALEDQTAP
jgi:hypothetical protein